VIGNQHLRIILNVLSRCLNLSHLSQVGFHHVGLSGHVDELLVGHGRAFGCMVHLGQNGQAAKREAAKG
jgi:hypothetical protein